MVSPTPGLRPTVHQTKDLQLMVPVLSHGPRLLAALSPPTLLILTSLSIPCFLMLTLPLIAVPASRSVSVPPLPQSLKSKAPPPLPTSLTGNTLQAGGFASAAYSR